MLSVQTVVRSRVQYARSILQYVNITFASAHAFGSDWRTEVDEALLDPRTREASSIPKFGSVAPCAEQHCLLDM